MSDDQFGLFAEPDPDGHLPARDRGSAHVLERQQKDLIARGRHPLSLGVEGPPIRLHPAARFADPDDPIPTCGTCRKRQFVGPGRPKCTDGSQQKARQASPGEDHEHGHVYYQHIPRATDSAATNVPEWWPACPQYQPEEAT